MDATEEVRVARMIAVMKALGEYVDDPETEERYYIVQGDVPDLGIRSAAKHAAPKSGVPSWVAKNSSSVLLAAGLAVAAIAPAAALSLGRPRPISVGDMDSPSPEASDKPASTDTPPPPATRETPPHRSSSLTRSPVATTRKIVFSDQEPRKTIAPAEVAKMNGTPGAHKTSAITRDEPAEHQARDSSRADFGYEGEHAFECGVAKHRKPKKGRGRHRRVERDIESFTRSNVPAIVTLITKATSQEPIAN